MPRLCNPFIVILNVGASHIAYVLKVDARTNTKHGIIAARGERVRPEAFTRSVTLQLHYGSRLSFSCRITVHLGSEPSFKVDRTLFSYTRNHRRAKTAQRRHKDGTKTIVSDAGWEKEHANQYYRSAEFMPMHTDIFGNATRSAWRSHSRE